METLKRFVPLLSLLALSACGPQAFVPGVVQNDQNAPGGMNVPPKVDILLTLDTQGAMKDIYPGMISRDIPEFVAKLEQSGWDYRIKAISVSESQPGSSIPLAPIAVSHYHGNWNTYGQWISPFPGALPTDPSLNLASALFSTLSASSFFPADISNNANDGLKPGLQNQMDFLSRGDVKSDFLRSDAMLAMITISTSKDTSNGHWTTSINADNSYWEANSNDATFLNQAQATILNAKNGLSSLVRYYAIVSQQQRMNFSCRGTNSTPGSRYISFSERFNGASSWSSKFDLCNNTIAQTLDQVAASLKSERLNFRKDKLILNTEPDDATLAVFKLDAQGTPVQLTRNQNCNPNASNAVMEYKYLGFVPASASNPIYTIDAPVSMGAVTTNSYVIQLCGGARLMGDEKARVEYMNQGARVAY